MINDLYGWYSTAEQSVQEPDYDPPHDAPCPYCGLLIHPGDVRTHAFMATEHPTRSYYYRTHATCDEAAPDNQKQAVFDGVLARIASDGEPIT
jgi:hypothetical protein